MYGLTYARLKYIMKNYLLVSKVSLIYVHMETYYSCDHVFILFLRF